MSGSAISLANGNFMGLRVASCDFTPEHVNAAGKNVSAKLVVNAYVNNRGRNGAEGKRDIFSFTIWGKLAHTCAKSMSRGKEWHCETRPGTYMGKVFHNRQEVTLSDGTVLMTKKVGFTVRGLVFGEESNKHIATEIQAGVRPLGWNNPGSPEEAQWKEILKSRQAVQFDPQQPNYGYARVRMPNGNYVLGQNDNAATASPAATNVQTTIAGVNPAAVVTPQTAPATPAKTENVQVSAGGFVVPGV